MASFLARRIGVMALTMLCLTLIVFYLVNLEPNLKKLAISQTEMHATSAELESWLVKNGYRRPFLERYAAWLGLWPKSPNVDPATGDSCLRIGYTTILLGALGIGSGGLERAAIFKSAGHARVG
jgi:peptide/nickel transport system permease protein